MKFAKTVAFSLLAWTVLNPLGSANAQQQYPYFPQLPQQQQQQQGQQQQFDPAPYYQWCDLVDTSLLPSLRTAGILYGQYKFDLAKQTMVTAFRQALAAMNLPGTFRPNSYREIARSLNLLNELEATTAASNLKSKMLANVAINRGTFVIRVKNILDRPYIIPYGPYGYQRGYGVPAPSLEQFELTLAGVAAEQLSNAQKYSAQIHGRRVYPMVDAKTYFTIIGNAAKWAAEDLSNLLFGQLFACGVLQLQQLQGDALAMAAAIGDPASVQITYERVEFLTRMLGSRPYCGF